MTFPPPTKPTCSHCHSLIRQRARTQGGVGFIEWIHVYPVQRREGGVNFWSLCYPDGMYRASLRSTNKFPRPAPFYMGHDRPWEDLKNSHRKPLTKLP